MAEVLSQLEIDNLLNEMNSGRIDVNEVISGKMSKGEISNYDFRRPNRISKNQVRTLQTIHENFSEVFGYYLVSKLQTVVSFTVTSVDQLFYSEFILSVSNPSCLYIFDMEGTDGSGIMEVSPELALTIVEMLLGGGGDIVPKPRTITPIEQAVIKGVIEHALSDLRNSWRAIADLNFRYSRLEVEADFVQVAPSSEIVVVVSFDVKIGNTNNTFMMNLCFPTFALEEVLSKLNKQQITTNAVKVSPKKIRDNIAVVNQQISTTRLPVIAELGKTSLTVGELLELKPGDVIKLENRINEEIEVIIGSRRKLAARPGTVDGKKAIRITRALKEEDLVEMDLSFKEKE
ncbi:MAG: flagellar motor switch protein FliM [Desulfobulbaceae bacterium]|nr:flagellar motor switch protein FliM [Candidatus Kapabacteria bacterium]MBS4000619.1 flagellar motor switch protein FliM [Desulfobulbaceae bacterium]